MQKKDIKFYDNKGIALITLIVAVLMMLIISSVIIYNTTSHLRINNLNNMYNDIRILNEQVFLYYSKYNELPILPDEYAFSISDEEAEFHIIDINKIDRNIKSNLKYGKYYYGENDNKDDIYIINTVTHQIFYVQGIKVDDTTYYTIPGGNEYQNISVDEIIANPPKLENNLKPIIYNENESFGNKITGTDQYDKNWYDYSSTDLSKWARARGESDADLYMWVPRYAYNTETNEIVFLKGTTDDPIQEKDITGNKWIIPDAFQNKEKEQLTGIWIYLGDKKINSKGDLITFVYELTGKDNTNGTAKTSITGADYTYYNPVIPVGFKTVPTRDASWNSTNGIQVDGWNDGLVIEDKDGNQFVWVPVDGTNVKYEKWYSSKNNATITTNVPNVSDLGEDTLPSGVTSEDAQITEYGGFYIARYESGIPTDDSNLTTGLTTASTAARNKSGVPISKKNQVPWNYISYTQAKANAESMYTSDLIKSGLATGKMWDITMKWLENSGVKVQTDSIEWGNYKNAPVSGITEHSTNYGASWTTVASQTKGTSTSWLLKTGHSEYTSRKNIYDLAGNLWEWTNEIYSSDRVMRGGHYTDTDISSRPAAYRSSRSINYSDYFLGFRCVLYIQ